MPLNADGLTVRAYQPAPAEPLDVTFPDLTETEALAMSRAAESIHTTAVRIKSRAGAWRTRDGLETIGRELDALETEARRLRAIINTGASHG